MPLTTLLRAKYSNFIKYMTSNGINWKNCVGFCSDGAAAMTGKHGGVFTQIKQVEPEAKFTHCSIHREALATKAMPSS
jgi:zinc finger BED domain-containing protein 5/7/8/9